MPKQFRLSLHLMSLNTLPRILNSNLAIFLHIYLITSPKIIPSTVEFSPLSTATPTALSTVSSAVSAVVSINVLASSPVWPINDEISVINLYSYRVFGKYCPIGRLRNLSWVKVFYKNVALHRKGKCVRLSSSCIHMYTCDLIILLYLVQSKKFIFRMKEELLDSTTFYMCTTQARSQH